MYDAQAVLHGTLKLTPTYLTGWGKMDIKRADLTSNLFKYKADYFD